MSLLWCEFLCHFLFDDEEERDVKDVLRVKEEEENRASPQAFRRSFLLFLHSTPDRVLD